MNRNQFLAGRIREVLLDGTWIANTNYQDQLKDLAWQDATRQTGSLNTIAHLTFHINYYLAGTLHFFKTGRLEISDKFSFDLLPINSDEAWQHLRSDLLNNAQLLADAVAQLDDARLDMPFADEKYGSFQRNIEGVIEHAYDHLGQMVLMKKMMD